VSLSQLNIERSPLPDMLNRAGIHLAAAVIAGFLPASHSATNSSRRCRPDINKNAPHLRPCLRRDQPRATHIVAVFGGFENRIAMA